MRQLLEILGKSRNFLLFIILECFSLYFVSKTNTIQGLAVVNSANSFAAYWYNKEAQVVNYFRLKGVNDSLLKENAQLHDQVAAYQNTDSFRNTKHSIPQWQLILPDTAGKPNDSLTQPVGELKIVAYNKYEYIPARVINNVISSTKDNIITINRGSEDGIKKDMPVVTYNGIIGQVLNVSDHYSTVITVLSSRPFTAMILDGSPNGIWGLLKWIPGSPDYLSLTQIPLQTKIKINDPVFTSSYSLAFPKGINIGKVSKIDTLKVNNTLNLKVKLNVDFRSVSFVYLIKDFSAAEKNELINQSSNSITTAKDKKDSTKH